MFKSKKDDYLKTHVTTKNDLKENETTFLSLQNNSRPTETHRSVFYIKHANNLYHIYDDLKNPISFINQLSSEVIKDMRKELKHSKKPSHIIIYCPPVHDKEPFITVWNIKENDFGSYDLDLEEVLDNEFLKYAKDRKVLRF